MHVLRSRILLRPRDFDRSVDFYEDQIGLVRSRDWGDVGHRGVVYFLGGGHLELSESASTDGANELRSADGARIRMWLQVADVETSEAELRERGVEIQQPAEMKPWGLIEMSIIDPDGLEIVIVEIPTTHPLRRRQ